MRSVFSVVYYPTYCGQSLGAIVTNPSSDNLTEVYALSITPQPRPAACELVYQLLRVLQAPVECAPALARVIVVVSGYAFSLRTIVKLGGVPVHRSEAVVVAS